MKNVKMMVFRDAKNLSGEETSISVNINFSCSSCKNNKACADKKSCEIVSRHMLQRLGGMFGKKYIESVIHGYDPKSDANMVYVDAKHDTMKAFKTMAIIQDALNKYTAR